MYNKNALLKRKILNHIQNNEYGQYVVKLFNRDTRYCFNIVVEYYPEIINDIPYDRLEIFDIDNPGEYAGVYDVLKVVNIQDIVL